MPKVLEQIKGLFSKRSNNKQLPPGSFPNTTIGNAATLGTIHKPQEEIDEEEDEDEEIGSMRNYNVPEQTRLREQSRATPSTDNFIQNRSPYRDTPTPSHPPIKASNTEFRNPSSGFIPPLPANNNNMNSAPNVPSRSGLPFLSQIQNISSQPPLNPVSTSNNNPPTSFNSFTSGTNQNQSTQPPPNNSQPSFGGFPPGMNPNQSTQPSAPNNSQPSFGGFPPGMMNPTQSSHPPPPPPNNPQPSFGGFPPGMMNKNQSTQPPPNNSQPSFGGFPPGMNPNQSTQPPPPNNSQPSFGGFPPGMMNPTQSSHPPPPPPNNPQPSFGGFPPGMNPNQSTQPPPPNNSQQSFGGFPPGMMNPTQSSHPPPPNNAQPSFGGFPPGMNSNQSTQPPPNTSQFSSNGFSSNMNNNQTSTPVPSNFQSNDAHNFPNSSNNYQSRIELDYPIENVLIDANIPQAMAVKINDAVEQDRLGNAYHIHRYTFQSSNPQQISYRDNDNYHHHHHQQNNRFGGSRYIREVDFHNPNSLYEDIKYPKHSDHHSDRQQHHDNSDSSLNHYIDQLLHTPGSYVIQAQDSNDLQHILQQQLAHNSIQPFTSTINSFPLTAPNTFSEPVFYYTAQALYNDPMRR